jgi:hypothetical protein
MSLTRRGLDVMRSIVVNGVNREVESFRMSAPPGVLLWVRQACSLRSASTGARGGQ